MVTASVVTAGMLAYHGYGYTWTGFGPQIMTTGEPVPAKTLWDWLDLLIVPVVLAVGAFLLDGSRRRSDREVENDRQRQQVLDAFFAYISDLLLERGLRDDDPPCYVRDLARLRTLSALRQLDGKRKVELLQFLYEAGLINHKPVIHLTGGDLRDAMLDEATLQGAELRGVYFEGASIRRANLTNTDMRGSDFTRVDFSGADLTGSRLAQANFCAATFRSAILKDADLGDVRLTTEQRSEIDAKA